MMLKLLLIAACLGIPVGLIAAASNGAPMDQIAADTASITWTME